MRNVQRWDQPQPSRGADQKQYILQPEEGSSAGLDIVFFVFVGKGKVQRLWGGRRDQEGQEVK
jgi:hypothetical protein